MGSLTIGMLHPGEMGAAVGQCLAGTGHQVLWVPEGRSPATGARAAAAGLTAAGLAGLIERSDIIMSVCPPHAAPDIARQVVSGSGSGFSGLYLDANAISPANARRIAAIVAGGPPLPWTVTTLGSLGTGGTPMVTKYQKFADGYKAEAVKLYRESNQTIAETARNLGLKESTLANWVKKDKDNEAVAVGEAPLTPAERTRIRELEADVRRLNMENAFLKKASAYFASQNL